LARDRLALISEFRTMTHLSLALLLALLVPTPDTQPPQARIDFPLPSALTDATTMRVRGSASDADGVAAVRVNGVPASTVDGFAHWWAVVPLLLGENALVVETIDALGNVDPMAATALVRRDGAIVRRPEGLALDPASDTCFVFDWVPDGALQMTQARILGVDLATGAIEVVSSRAKGTGPLPRYATGEMEYDPVAGRLLLMDGIVDRMLAVDPRTGDRMVVSGPGVGTGPAFASAIGLELDPANGRAWVFNRSFEFVPGSGALLGVDLASGNRSVVSSPTVGSGPWPAYESKMSRAPDGQRLLVACWMDEVVLGIDLASGHRAIVSDAASALGTPWTAVWDVAVGVDGRAWAGSSADGRIFAFDPASGAHAAVAAPPADDRGEVFDVELDLAHDRLLAADDRRAAILALPLSGGEARVWVRNSIGGGSPFRRSLVAGVAVDRSGRAWMVDGEQAELVAVGLADGVRTPVSGGSLGAGPALDVPIDVALDESTGTLRALVLDIGLKAVVAVDLASGDRSLVSGAGVGAGPVFNLDFYPPTSLEVAGSTAWVMDTGLNFFENRLLAVDLASGNRTLVSGDGVGAGPMLFESVDLALDVQGGRALSFIINNDLIAIDLASGDRSVLSGAAVGGGPTLGDPVHLCWDALEQRALVYGRLAGVTAVDGATGERVRLAVSDANKGPGLAWPASMALWRPQAGGEPILLLGDHELTSLGAIDLAWDAVSSDVPAWRAIVSR
jgi:hypothetical protein